MRKILSEIKFEEVKGKTYELINVVELLCEVCEKPLGRREKTVRNVHFQSIDDYENLMTRAAAHDCAEVDVVEHKIYFYDHDFPGNVHEECIEKL